MKFTNGHLLIKKGDKIINPQVAYESVIKRSEQMEMYGSVTCGKPEWV